MAAAIALAACGEREDPRIQQLTSGISRDSALKILAGGSTDTLANIYRREQYLLNGKMIEILFFSPAGQKEGQGEAAAENTLRPVVVTEGTVSGWGWAYFDSVAKANEIRVRAR